MGSLNIKTERKEKIYIAELGHAKENLMWVCLEDKYNLVETYINKEQAQQIIEHLKTQFDL